MTEPALDPSKSRIASIFLACGLYVAGVSLATRSMGPELQYGAIKALPDLLVLMLLLVPAWFASTRFPRSATVGAAVISVLWMLAYTAQLQFLVETGQFASRPLILFAAGHLGDVGKVASSGVKGIVVAEMLIGSLLIVGAAIARPLHRGLSEPAGNLAVNGLALIVAVGAIALPYNGSAVAGPILSNSFSSELPTLSAEEAPRYVAPVLDLATLPSLEKRPNIVIWIIESGRADIVDYSGKHRFPPFINQLADESLKFKNTYITTSHTSKALVGILCGHYARPQMQILEAGTSDWRLTCLPHLLRQAGYKSTFLQAALGSFENRKGLTANLGFDTTVVQEDLDPKFEKAGYFGMDERALLDPLAKAAALSKDSPIFLTLLTNLTHHPYALAGQKEPTDVPPVAYGAAVEYVDSFLADAYQRMGKHLDWNNTLLIVLGDHGEAFGEHALMQHDVVSYQEVVSAPLFIRYPAQIKPGVDAGLRQQVDILPTVLQTIGANWTGQIAGQSLLKPSSRDHVVTTCWYTNSCHAFVAADGMKMIFRFGSAPESVFDLNNDPLEKHDLVADPRFVPLVYKATAAIARARAFAVDAHEPKQALASH